MKLLSIIVPCYNEGEAIPLFYPAVDKVVKTMKDLAIEYWFIDDGSKDNTLQELRKLQSEHPDCVHYITFSRNFGKEAALYASMVSIILLLGGLQLLCLGIVGKYIGRIYLQTKHRPIYIIKEKK